MEKNRANLLKWFRSLSDNELVDVFYEAIACRDGPNEVAGACESRFALAHVSRERVDEGWGPWEFEVLCPSPGFEPDSPLCQAGRHCGFETLSCGKRARCPICGGDVYGT